MTFKPGESGNPNTQFKPGESGNPSGKPKGTIHLSTRIQNMLNDPNFLPENLKGYRDNPMDAIIATAIKKSADGDSRWAKWLSDSGYGQKLQLEHSGEVNTGTNDPTLAAQFADYIKEKSRD